MGMASQFSASNEPAGRADGASRMFAALSGGGASLGVVRRVVLVLQRSMVRRQPSLRPTRRWLARLLAIAWKSPSQHYRPLLRRDNALWQSLYLYMGAGPKNTVAGSRRPTEDFGM